MKIKFTTIFITLCCFTFFTQATIISTVPLFADQNKHNEDNANPEILKRELIELEKEIKSFSLIFEKVSQLIGPSVVKINITRDEKDTEDKPNAMNKPFIPPKLKPYFKPFDHNSFNLPMAEDHSKRDIGSGVIIDKAGYIITNNHVVHDFVSGTIVVSLFDGRNFDGKIVGVDPKTDLAVLKIEGDNLQAAEFGNVADMHVGDWVIAVGSPFNYQQTVSAGIISAIGRKNVNPHASPFAYEDYIQTDASINPGSSGGPLVNLRGEIIGINAAIATRSGGFQGIGFAISEVIVRKVTKQLIEKGTVHRGFVGMGMLNINEKLAETMGLDSTEDAMNYLGITSKDGVFVARVWDGTPAADTHVVPGDIVLELDDKIINNAESMQRIIRNLEVGSTVEIVIIRNGKKLSSSIKIGEQPENMKGIGFTSVQKGILGVGYGLVVMQISNKIAKKLEKEIAENGILVIEVLPESEGDKAGIKAGDIITHVGTKEVKTLSDFCNIFIKLKKDNKPISVKILSKGFVTLF